MADRLPWKGWSRTVAKINFRVFLRKYGIVGVDGRVDVTVAVAENFSWVAL
jgi:hypothetical protein